MKRMRFRSKAALYSGKIKGPKHSRKSGRDEAGWKGVKAGLKVSNTIASLKARFRCPSGLSPGRNRRLSGESTGDSGATVSGLPILKESQYSESARVSHISAACFLSSSLSVASWDELMPGNTNSVSSRSFGACLQLFPSLPELNGTRTPIANIFALRSASAAGWLRNALTPAYCSWTKYLEAKDFR